METIPAALTPMVAKTMSGLEEILATELEQLGAAEIKILHRAVSFTGDKALTYRANYCCRTALRILLPFYSFTAGNENELYNGVYQFDWTQLLDLSQTFAIDTVVSNSPFRHTQYVSQKVKDAIVDQFREKKGSRPSVNIEDPDIRINIHIQEKECTLALDSSGASLHKRGYRRNTHEAQINEVLAAGLIALSGWDKMSPFVDFMCGSGTLLLEAAMVALGIPAGHYRRDFGFSHWKDYDSRLWRKVREEHAFIKSDAGSPLITGCDHSMRSIAQARENITHAGLQEKISIKKQDMAAFIPPLEPGIVLINPPYGERIEVEDIVQLYKNIGDVLKTRYAGYTAWIISSDLQALKFIGLHPNKKLQVFNGPLECRFQGYSLYQGSRKGPSGE